MSNNENDEMKDFFGKAGTQSSGRSPSPKAQGSSAETVEVASDGDVSMTHGGIVTEDAERRWAANDQNFWACSATYDNIPAGLYKPKHSNNIGHYLEKQIVDTDELLYLPDTASESVIEEIEKFWTLKDQFNERGFIHKRGILMWGDPGSGKTATIQLMIKSIIESGGLAIFAQHPDITTACLQMIRRIEPDRKIIVVLEDFESMVREFGDSEFLAMLDGESQVGDVVFVATTNYPEKLDKRFIDRPSRFDTIKKIGMPTAAAREFYLSHKESTLVGEELAHWVKSSKGMSIAHLKEMIISNRCYGIPIEKVIKRLDFMKKRDISSDDAIDKNGDKFGFDNASANDDDSDSGGSVGFTPPATKPKKTPKIEKKPKKSKTTKTTKKAA